MSWWMLGILMKSIFQKWKGSDKVGNSEGTGYTKFGFRVPIVVVYVGEMGWT